MTGTQAVEETTPPEGGGLNKTEGFVLGLVLFALLCSLVKFGTKL